MWWSGGGFKFDGVAELFELADEVFASTFWLVASGEVVGSEFFVDGFVGEEVPADHEHRAGNGDDGTLFAASFPDELVTDSEVAVHDSDR